MERGIFASLGNLAARYPWMIVVLWLSVAGASILPTTRVVGELKAPSIDVPDREAGKASAILEEEFDRVPERTAIAVFTSEVRQVSDPLYRDAAVAAIDRVKALKGVQNSISYYDRNDPRFLGSDGRTTYAIFTFAGTSEEAAKLVPEVRRVLKAGPADPAAYLTGFPAFSEDIQVGSQEDAKHAEMVSMPVTMLLLLIVFGTLIAAGLPVILGSVAVLVTLMLIYFAALRWDVSIFAMNTSTVLGLGLGIDFSLLMVSRFREELAAGLPPRQATVRTVATAGQSIVFSGLTVILGISVLMVYDLVDIRSIAGAMMVVTAIAVAAAVTLLPALLVLFGRRINAWNIIPGRGAVGAPTVGRGRWHAWSLAVMRRPWLFLLGSLAILTLLAIPAREMRPFGAGGFRGISKNAESRLGYEAVTRAFPAGETSPIAILVSTGKSDGAWDERVKEGVFRLTETLKADPRVARVDSIATLQPNMTIEQVKALGPELLAQNPALAGGLGQYINLDRGADVQLVTVISKTDELSKESSDLVEHIRGTVIPRTRELGGTTVQVTGQTALQLDYRDKLWGRLPLVIGLVLLVTYVVLLLFFHSIILPLKAILMNVASIAASYGVLVMVFQWGIADRLLRFDHLGFVSDVSPVILFAVLFGLSTDYEVFLLSRVKELYKHGRSNEESVAEGLERTAGLITAAGLIMLGVFGAFALADILVMKEIGVGVAVAVLLDATIIRVVIVPATMKLMGATNWYMPPFLRWIPEISEGGEPTEAPGWQPLAEPVLACSLCRHPIRVGGRFCRHCGAPLVPPAPEVGRAVAAGLVGANNRVGGAAAVGASAGGGRAADVRATGARPAAAEGPAGAPAAVDGAHVLPVSLVVQGVRRRSWVRLRRCQVELGQEGGDAPSITFSGMIVEPLAGQDPLVIEVVNARVRL